MVMNFRSFKALCFKRIICILLGVYIMQNCSAQICQGSLGDPIVNITFGSGPNPGAPLPAATTNYTYVSTDCPGDGKYAVRNRTDSCFDNLWYSVTDHTGDASGYFMIVNASYDPGQFYLDTVKGLCPQSTYEFASWIINLSKPILCWGAPKIILPNITFRIEKTDGTLLQSYNTNDISSSNPPQWRQYGFFFTTPAGVSDIVLRMVNNAPGGCGNDVGLDDITFRPCGPQINSSIQGSSSTSDTLCGGTDKTYTFIAQSSPGYINPTYQWQKNVSGSWTDIPGATSTNYTVNFPSNTTAGIYSYRIVTAESGNIGSPKCRISSQTVNVIVTAKTSLSVTGNSPVCEGNDIVMNASSPILPVDWQGPNGFTASGYQVIIGNSKPAYSGKYYATVRNGNCTSTDSLVMNVVSRPDITLNTYAAKICQGDSIRLTAAGADNYQWSPAAGISSSSSASIQAYPSITTTYNVTGWNAEGCSDTAAVVINIIPKPTANAGPDRFMLKGSSIQLTGTAGGDSLRYYWTPDYAMTGSQSLNPTVAPLVDTTYVLHVVCLAGCGTAEASAKVTIYKEIAVPNAFSPNGDGINDRWNIPGLSSYPQAEVAVFDRYGRELFRRKSFDGWDGTGRGKMLPPGNYYYIIDLRNDSPKLYGWVYLAK
jgi:gliding motility-associated-like protein